MQIVGIQDTSDDGMRVHTIDVWFSERRQAWFVERLDAAGHQLGVAHRCDSEAEAEVCLQDWLRAHTETQLVSPRQPTMAERRLMAHASRRAA